MLNSGVVDINRQGVFSVQEAQAIVPVIRKITEEYSTSVNELVTRLESLDSSSGQLTDEIESQVSELINAWHAKVKKLGGEPKGLWLVDFDSGDGYFCWKFPESEISHWHHYDEGFLGRKPLSERKVIHESSSRTDQLHPW